MKTVIDIFSGAGGLSEGFKQAGFNILAANDIDSYSAATFRLTHPETKFLESPIEELDADDFLHTTGLEKGELDCLVGGPPCQAFSVYNHQRGLHDERSGLFREYLRIVAGLYPKWVVMENVTGMSSVGNGYAIKAVQSGLAELGYTSFEYKILFSEEYGVPQERRRIIFLANRLGEKIVWPQSTHGGHKQPFVDVESAIFDLPRIKNGEGAPAPAPYSIPLDMATEFQKKMRAQSNSVYNHEAPRLGEINIKRMRHIPQGGSWRDIPPELLPEGMKRAKRSDHTKRYGRLHPRGLSSTILTKCDVHWGAFIHPTQDRAITVREAARLQSFPDHFIFQGPRTEQYKQVGNAVPPMLAMHIAIAIKEAAGDC